MTGSEQHRISAIVRLAIVTGLFVPLMMAGAAQSQTFQVLHTFTGGADGAGPVGGLTMDRAGPPTGRPLPEAIPEVIANTVAQPTAVAWYLKSLTTVPVGF